MRNEANPGRRTGVWWKAAGVALLAVVSAAVFSAYLRPDMFIAFADVFSFCMNLLR